MPAKRPGHDPRKWYLSATAVILCSTAIAHSEQAPRRGAPVIAVHKVLDIVPAGMMLGYFRRIAGELADRHRPVTTHSEWLIRRRLLRDRLWKSLGDFPRYSRPPPNARVMGVIDHGDHTVEKIVYQSLPGLYVTALVYVPNRTKGPVPAVICVNGHWAEAKATPIIQKRCMMLARLGMIAFCQDVIGTGERAAFDGTPPTTYHGFYRGAAPRIVDRSLLGYIMYECLRAADYLASRPDVDATRMMCTGASGGGKQSMFFPALDDRLRGGVPVCYISSYVEHMGATACVGEIPTGVLRYTDQWEILGLHAPRPLLAMAAMRDVPVFAPEHADRVLRRTANHVYRLYGADERVRLDTFDSKHDYNRPMRERFYRHATTHLLGRRDVDVREPDDLPVQPEEMLRCGLPASSENLQSLTCRRARELASAIEIPERRAPWERFRRQLLSRLEREILGSFPNRRAARSRCVRELDWKGYRVQHWALYPEPGVSVPAVLCLPGAKSTPSDRRGVVVVDESGKQHAFARGLVERLLENGMVVLAIDYRGTGETAGTVPSIGYGPAVPDYNLSNYALLVGRPLAGMRVHDVRCALDLLAEHPQANVGSMAVAGRGRGALVGLLAGALDDRVKATVLEELFASWVFPEEFVDIGLSSLIPRILTAGDIQHITACMAPRGTFLLNPVDGRRRPLSANQLDQWGPFAAGVYRLYDATSRLNVVTVASDTAPDEIAAWLRPR